MNDEERTAVVVDRWPIVRLGLGGILAGAGIAVVAEAAKAAEGLLLIRAHAPAVVVIGSPMDGLNPGFVRSAKSDVVPPRLLVLLPRATPAEAAAFFAAGADALLLASSGQEELSVALARIRAGERVVGPGLGVAVRAGASTLVDEHEPLEEPGNGGLTAKEREVLVLLAQGHSNKQIARALFIGEPTVKTHLAHVYAKLGVQSRHGALARAAELGLLL